MLKVVYPWTSTQWSTGVVWRYRALPLYSFKWWDLTNMKAVIRIEANSKSIYVREYVYSKVQLLNTKGWYVNPEFDNLTVRQLEKYVELLLREQGFYLL